MARLRCPQCHCYLSVANPLSLGEEQPMQRRPCARCGFDGWVA